MDKEFYQIDEVSKITGLTKRMLRYYEEINLISSARKESGYRLYSADDIKMLKDLRDKKEKLGFSMDDLKAFSSFEKNIKNIISSESADEDSVNQCNEEARRLLSLIEEKEEILIKVKTRLNKAIKKLDTLTKEK